MSPKAPVLCLLTTVIAATVFAFADRPTVTVLGSGEQSKLRGGQFCYVELYYGNNCPPSPGGPCTNTLCSMPATGDPKCPNDTTGYYNINNFHPVGCTLGDSGYYQCPDNLLVCWVTNPCFGCILIEGLYRCNILVNQKPGPPATYKSIEDYGCTAY